MGIGSDLPCCTCPNLMKSIFFDPSNQNNKDDIKETDKKIGESNITQNKNNSKDFNKAGSQIVNATSFIQEDKFILKAQEQTNDSFDNMFEELEKKEDN